MRRFAIMVLSLCLILCSSLVVYAAEPIQDVVQIQQVIDEKEMTAIQNAIDTSNVNPKEFTINNRKIFEGVKADEKELSYGIPYKVYIANKDILEAIVNEKPILDLLLASPYNWEVPILYQGKSVDTFTVSRSENGWEIVETGSYLSPELIELSSTPELIVEAAQRNSLESADSFVHFRIAPLHSDYIYLTSGKNDFFCPLIHGGREINGLKNSEFYSRDQLLSHIGPAIKQVMEQSNLDSGYQGTQDKGVKSYNVILWCIILIAGSAMIYFILRRYHRPSSSGVR